MGIGEGVACGQSETVTGRSRACLRRGFVSKAGRAGWLLAAGCWLLAGAGWRGGSHAREDPPKNAWQAQPSTVHPSPASCLVLTTTTAVIFSHSSANGRVSAATTPTGHLLHHPHLSQHPRSINSCASVLPYGPLWRSLFLASAPHLERTDPSYIPGNSRLPPARRQSHAVEASWRL